MFGHDYPGKSGPKHPGLGLSQGAIGPRKKSGQVGLWFFDWQICFATVRAKGFGDTGSFIR
jgi:hypothetical protein